MKTYTIVITADQAAELNLLLRRAVVREGKNMDQSMFRSMFRLSAALGAARHRTPGNVYTAVVDSDNITVDVTAFCPTTKTGGER